ncbi:MAG: hypothetical protein KGP35_00925 [Bacteroidetes bacterium]|nr:hypothetical protein [Bacteroidota bacterium]
MRTAVCTLYEGNYHFGVAALINSLVANQFKGDVFVGYRGELPPWFRIYQYIHHDFWGEVVMMQLSDYTKVYFIKSKTTTHFTNYKPQFLIDLSKDLCARYDAIAYFDPDIVVCRSWDYFEDWMQHGVAVVHDVIMHDMPTSHPLRKNWEQIIKQNNRTIQHYPQSYVNAGFCGLKKKYWDFPVLWNDFIEIAFADYKAEPSRLRTNPRPNPFFYPDQDSLNIALMCYIGNISELGPEGMGFRYGVVAMAHAVGSLKPWNKKYFRSFLNGVAPTYAEKKYWEYANTSILVYSLLYYRMMKLKIRLFSFLGRFYKRN